MKNNNINDERYVLTKIRRRTQDRIRKFGSFRDTWDDLINKMAEICEKNSKNKG